uniref:Uncharacterized protein n=1 Tax=Timema cristinae TaxID=61476 RepID=A0A7R9GX91_TIMCR|nr:unnamed protein product [Timema cristinae]
MDTLPFCWECERQLEEEETLINQEDRNLEATIRKQQKRERAFNLRFTFSSRQKRVLGLSKKQIRRIAFEFAEWLGISSSRFDSVRRVADKRWYHDLETRHPHLSVFKTRLQQENLDSTTQEEKVKRFLDYLENVTYKY